jgi:hypothetical protein
LAVLIQRKESNPMRRNSGDDEGRNRHLNPTVKEHERELGKSGSAVLDRAANKGKAGRADGQRTTGLGSNARNGGQKGR